IVLDSVHPETRDAGGEGADLAVGELHRLFLDLATVSEDVRRMMRRAVLVCVAFLGLVCLAAPAGGEPRGRGAKFVTNSIGMKLVPIPAGKFQMGSPATEPEREDRELLHEVTISKPFYLGVYEVTQREYDRLMGRPREGGKHNPWNFGYRFGPDK